MNSEYQKQYTLSLYINAIRNILLGQNFFEHHLYSTTNYKIENTDSFSLNKNLYLRYNPEPDIWQIGISHDKFFWIGSMFRNEKKLTDLHRYEFTVVDIYQLQKTMSDVVVIFLDILKKLEHQLNLPNLSELEVKYLPYEEFSKGDQNMPSGKYWLVVTDYPVDESFYDTKGGDDGHTSKFEIFLVNQNECIEIAACGQLGENLNKDNLILNNKNYINKNLIDKKFIGFGFGLERLMFLYSSK